MAEWRVIRLGHLGVNDFWDCIYYSGPVLSNVYQEMCADSMWTNTRDSRSTAGRKLIVQPFVYADNT